RSSPVLNASGTQTTATVKCPKGTEPLGGGGFSSSRSLFANINSTLPSRREWIVTQNNASALDASLVAVVVCGTLPHYSVVLGPQFPTPVDGRVSGLASCPARSVVIGGGIASASTSLAVNTYFQLPNGNRWESGIANDSGFGSLATPFAVCAR